MTMKRFQCRTHQGGIFSVPPRRGRPPVRCTEEFPCDKSTTDAGIPEYVPAESKATLASARSKIPAPKGPVGNAASLALARAAKAQLTAVGWEVQGKAANDRVGITASRGSETLIMAWVDGKLTENSYSLLHEKPSDNGFPQSRLTFNPHETTDSELVRLLQGMKVTWWNTLGGSTESGIIGNKISIEHIFDGSTENNKRLVKFVDHSGGGFRAFHIEALLKVG